MVKKPKSGNIIIKLSPNEVKEVLSPRGYTSLGRESITKKIRSAVEKKFTGVTTDEYAEQNRAFAILHKFHDSTEYKELAAQHSLDRRVIDTQSQELNASHSKQLEVQIQALLDAECVTGFRAAGYHIERVEVAKK